MPDPAAVVDIGNMTLGQLFGVGGGGLGSGIVGTLLMTKGYKIVQERFGESEEKKDKPCPINGRLGEITTLSESMTKLADHMESFCSTVLQDHSKLADATAAAQQQAELRDAEHRALQGQILSLQKDQVNLLQSHGQILAVLSDRRD